MEIERKPLRCYIGSSFNDNIDPFLKKISFSRGLILFAIPDYGILFRCRADGKRIDLEYGAMLSVLRFITKKLSSEKIKTVQIISSMPELVYSFINLREGSTNSSNREKLITEYKKSFDISISYIEQINNPIFRSTIEFPSLPKGIHSPVSPGPEDHRKGEFKRIQRGIRI